MQQYYQHFPEIDNIYWTEYFLKEFIPKYKFFENISDESSSFIQYDKKDFSNELEIHKLSLLLTSKLKFPPISYIIIFRHNKLDQPIHADGMDVPRYASLNLPLTGYEGTRMCFYKTKLNVLPKISNANYFNQNDVDLVSEFNCNNEWALVNSSVPHNIVNINSSNPRLTLCVRFLGNPSFKDLVNNAKL